MPLPYVMPTAPLFYSITMKTEYEPKTWIPGIQHYETLV